MTDRDDEERSTWVDAPELPDPVGWGAPRSLPSRPPSPTVPAGQLARATVVPVRRWLWGVLGLVVAIAVVAGATSTGDAAASSGHVRPPDASVVARYVATSGGVGEPRYEADGVTAADRAEHERLWAEWTAIVPSFYLDRIVTFEIASDGAEVGGYSAYVSQLDVAGDEWLLAVDPADERAAPERYDRTLVHELAHVITLGGGARDIEPGPFTSLAEGWSVCDGVAVRSGCAADGSLLATFTARFWTSDDVAAADRLATRAAGDTDAVVVRYEQRRDAYVSAYAVTDPAEDLAETIVAAVFGDRQPRGSVAEQKVALVESDPEVGALTSLVQQALYGG